MKRNYCVYKHILKNDNRVYIGITCKKPEYRWNDGKGYKSCTFFNNAINKYGWDNFEHQIICTGLTKEEAEFEEIKLIEEAKSTDPKYGFNIRKGGDLASVNQCKPVNLYGLSGKFIKTFDSIKSLSEELGLNMNSIVRNCKLASCSKSVGGYMTRYNNSEFPPGVDISPYIKFKKPEKVINLYYDGKSVDSGTVKQLADKYSLNPSDLYNCINGKLKAISNYTVNNKAEHPKKKFINAYDLSGKYICTCNNMSEAGRKFGVDRSSIQRCCSGNANRAGEYIFRIMSGEFPAEKDLK